jgi:hypothetical protein
VVRKPVVWTPLFLGQEQVNARGSTRIRMVRKSFFGILLVLSVAAIVYGGFFREFLIFDNLEKFDKLKDVGITIKIPGYEQKKDEFTVQSQWFTEPEVVNATTFEGIGKYKDGRLISNYPDLRMLKGRRPCPT